MQGSIIAVNEIKGTRERIGEGNGNQFQCSCLENPRDGGAWWAAVYGVAQSRTRLTRLQQQQQQQTSEVEFQICMALRWALRR